MEGGTHDGSEPRLVVWTSSCAPDFFLSHLDRFFSSILVLTCKPIPIVALEASGYRYQSVSTTINKILVRHRIPPHGPASSKPRASLRPSSASHSLFSVSLHHPPTPIRLSRGPLCSPNKPTRRILFQKNPKKILSAS